MRTVAVLFARPDSIYKTLPGTDVWDMERDARKFPGGMPIVGHPPCRAWGVLRHMAKPRPDEKDLARWTVDQIRKWGGVLEHPYGSQLWADKKLPKPGELDEFAGFTLSFPQLWFGHEMNKFSKFYVCGIETKNVPEIPFKLGYPTATMNHFSAKKLGIKELKHSDREKSPPALAEWLLELARRTHKPKEPKP